MLQEAWISFTNESAHKRKETPRYALESSTRDDVADMIGSDHAPHSLENKKKEYPQTPSGMPGVQTLVPLMLNHVNNNKLTLNQFVKLVCENPVKNFWNKKQRSDQRRF